MIPASLMDLAQAIRSGEAAARAERLERRAESRLEKNKRRVKAALERLAEEFPREAEEWERLGRYRRRLLRRLSNEQLAEDFQIGGFLRETPAGAYAVRRACYEWLASPREGVHATGTYSPKVRRLAVTLWELAGDFGEGPRVAEITTAAYLARHYPDRAPTGDRQFHRIRKDLRDPEVAEVLGGLVEVGRGLRLKRGCRAATGRILDAALADDSSDDNPGGL